MRKTIKIGALLFLCTSSLYGAWGQRIDAGLVAIADHTPTWAPALGLAGLAYSARTNNAISYGFGLAYAVLSQMPIYAVAEELHQSDYFTLASCTLGFITLVISDTALGMLEQQLPEKYRPKSKNTLGYLAGSLSFAGMMLKKGGDIDRRDFARQLARFNAIPHHRRR